MSASGPSSSDGAQSDLYTKLGVAASGVVPPAYANDPKYKKYTQQVEKCLASFDSVHEWADFISFLKQLLKTLQAYMQFKEIPRKVIVAKRLSQCLNPALPTGVHQRALDVYAHILAVLGSEGLLRDLALWSSGLFPFFEYAAMSVKPTLLTLFDTHYLPLQAGLRPIMKSFILALLPGLEEENGEFFDKTLGLVDRISGTVSPSFFLQNVWLVMLTSPSSRGSALNFLSRRLPKLKPDEDLATIVGRDIGLMIRAVAAALEDDDSLVRRGALDILCQSLPLDSVAVKNAPQEDRAILMRAATSVVLRRDLALNRRLYHWLLSADENSKQQLQYFKTWGLPLLTTTLREDIFNPAPEYSASRPFKIFISLLDKWEIGAPLTEALVFDAFRALKQGITVSDSGDEMALTASTLYEAVEPLALWKQLMNAVLSDVCAEDDQYEGIRMVAYIVATFHSHDEEIEALHLPVCFAATLEVLVACAKARPNLVSRNSSMECLALLHEISKHIRPAYLKAWHNTSDDDAAAVPFQNAYTFACTFYSLDSAPGLVIETQASSPLVAVFDDLASLSLYFARALSAKSAIPSARETSVKSLVLFKDMAQQLQVSGEEVVTLGWNPKEWLSAVLECIKGEAIAFPVLDNSVSAVITLHETTCLEPRLSIDNRTTLLALGVPLLRYLGPAWSSYHQRAVNLIWALENAAGSQQIVAIISQSLTSQDSLEVREACEAFGVLWRLTDDNAALGFRLKVPMMIVLDTLKSDDPNLRRIGETWMRCSLKSYLRILDPMIYDLCDPGIRRSTVMLGLNGRQVERYEYERPFDQRYILHVLNVLSSVVKFGGQGLNKVARATPIGRSSHAAVRERARTVVNSAPETSYMDVILSALLGYLKSEPKAKLLPTMAPFNEALQSSVVDLLQALIARGEVDLYLLQAAENDVVGKLFTCVHTGRLDLQNKLLHLLHSVISASSLRIQGDSSRTFKAPDRSPEVGSKISAPLFSLNPLLTQTLIDGISIPSNRAILQHWLDFILMTIPQFHEMLLPTIIPLNDCVCRQLRDALTEVTAASSADASLDNISIHTTDADFIMLLNALERLVLLSLSQAPESSQVEDEMQPEKSVQEGSGLLGYVSNVFSTDSGSMPPEDTSQIKPSDPRCMQEAIRVLWAMWEQLVVPPQSRWGSQEESLTLIYTRARTRCRRVLEHLFKAHPLEVLESVVECWYRDTAKDDSASFELVDVLTSSAQTVVHMLCETIQVRIPGMTDRPRRHTVCPTTSDVMLFEFLEQYLGRLEGPLAVQVWGRCLQFFKDLLATFREFKLQVFHGLRCLTVLTDKVTQTTALEDKRARKELQETYSKMVELCLFAGRSYEQGSWIRRGQATFGVNGTGRESPIPRARSELKVDEKLNSSTTSLPNSVAEPAKASASSELVDHVNLYLASDVVPRLRKFLVESDKILALSSSIVTTVVSPSLKSRAKPLDVDETILGILRELAKIASAIKAWRGPIVDMINDNRCFNSTPTAGRRWRVLIKMLFETDKSALNELLSRITTAPSANIFTNREYEMLLRSLNLRRLSYVILSGEKNQFLTQLPTIQEKLVDTLRNVTAPVVQSEVYLCVRVLLCRLSPHNLSSFWPTILTELYRVFEAVLLTLPSDGSEELSVILAAGKLLDLLLVLQTEEFQVHQWIFITDTVDAIYKPEHWVPVALLDRLSDAAGQLPSEGETGRHRDQHGTLQAPVTEARHLRRPLLNAMHQIDSIRDLIPFFSQVSMTSYESVYTSGGNVDWEAVEEGLFQDMFDGR
ncbi:Dopey, N-terminal-domain-containing protein [Phanerochaete sordida]|uniref:Dopey, N-terminal-domain-containing protein n=1 Tax=Phanerochaete sordida TaxID=48140 RepID=A0A9P3G1K4_9APHY|nr:Dopey, N-terminal-domain-containing protein [Phanerochaete sordida]